MDTDEGGDDVIALPTASARAKKAPKPPPPAADPMADVTRDADAMSASELKEYLGNLTASNAEMQFALSREKPTLFKGVPCHGMIDKFFEAPDEDDIRATYGGGTYKLVIHRRDATGKMKYVTTRRFSIAGDPILTSLPGYEGKDTAAPVVVSPGGKAADAAIHVLQTEVDRMRQREDRNMQQSGFDPALIQMLQAPFAAQMTEMSQTIRDLQTQLLSKTDQAVAAAAQRPDTHFQDNLLEKMFTSDATRLEAMREAHASELRQLRESHRDELRKLKDDHSDAIKAIDKRWEQVVTAITGAKDTESRIIGSAKDSEIRSLEAGYKLQISMLEREIAQLRADFAKSEGEVGALRAKKDKTLVEQANEINEIKEALGVGEDKEERGGIGGTLERIVESVLENPEAIGDLLGMRKTAEAAPQESAAARVQAKRVAIAQRKAAQVNAAPVAGQAAPAVPAVAGAPAEPAALPKPERPAEGDIKLAVTFIENAIRSGTEPEVFAESTRSLVPRNVMAYLEAVGIDEFLGTVSSLDAASPLRTQAGRNWIRKVAKYLVEGVTD
jgi:hypothetical protein